PVARELGFNSRDGVFGNGYRPNAAVGRAVRLALWNLGGATPWETDKATLSHPGEYAFCIAEEAADTPWPPLHEERGCPRGSAAEVRACGEVHEQFRRMEREAGRYPPRYDMGDPATRLPITPTPDDIHIVVAGGRSYFAAVLPGWGGFGGFAVTRPIRRRRRAWSS